MSDGAVSADKRYWHWYVYAACALVIDNNDY